MNQSIRYIKSLVEQDKLKEALSSISLLTLPSVSSDQVLLIQSRLSSLEENEMMGILSAENGRIERNLIRQAIIKIISSDPVINKTDTQKSIIALFNEYIILEDITFEIDNISCSKIENHNEGLAKLSKEYSWTITLTCTLCTAQVRALFQMPTNELEISLNEIRLKKDYSYSNQSAKIINRYLWNSPGDKDPEFWSLLPTHTYQDIESKLHSDDQLKNHILKEGSIAIRKKMRRVLDSKNFRDVSIKVNTDYCKVTM